MLQEFIEANHKKIHITNKLREKVEKHYGVTKTLFDHYKIEVTLETPFVEYARYVLINGTEGDKTAFANGIQMQLAVREGVLIFRK